MVSLSLYSCDYDYRQLCPLFSRLHHAGTRDYLTTYIDDNELSNQFLAHEERYEVDTMAKGHSFVNLWVLLISSWQSFPANRNFHWFWHWYISSIKAVSSVHFDQIISKMAFNKNGPDFLLSGRILWFLWPDYLEKSW